MARPPVSLGRHQLLFAIGHGGMSDVYLAVVTSAAGVNKLLVAKQLRASLLDEPEALSMFMDEARLAARLHHPNVVQTFEVGQEGPIPYITMEFLDGQPLSRVLRRETMSLGMRLRVITEMLEGLHYAHELRDYDGSPLDVVHRDVSPQNLFITYDGQIKLVDFGIAKASGAITRTEGSGLKGKLAYMSPQQARGEALDRRADLFAAGVMLWELLSGRRLWGDTQAASIARQLSVDELPALDAPELPPRLLEICRRAMEPDAAARYSSAELFRHELEVYMDTEGLDASSRAIGKRVAAAFASERAQMRNRIDAELLRIVGAPSSGDLPSLELWREPYRGEQSERTLGSGEYLRPDPDEATVNEGPIARGSLALREPPRYLPASERTREDATPSGAHPELSSIRRGLLRRADIPRTWVVGGIIALGVVSLTPIVLSSIDRANHRSVPTSRSAPPSSEASIGLPEVALPQPGEATLGGRFGDCDAPNKPQVELSGEIEADATLRCDRNYLLRFQARVSTGVTLTIEPGTTILGDRETKGTLVVEPGARLVAEGTPERPIVFTSSRPPTQRRAGDWGGVVLLGQAPLNLRDADGHAIHGLVEGILAGGSYGGDDPEDDSGVLRYVRIEYPGVELAPANELNGLTLAGVGRGTTLDHIQVRATSDDCFEFFGGTVDAKHLICDQPGDDAFDFDYGYQGRLQHLLVRDLPATEHDEEPSNAFEFDNDPRGAGVEPRTAPRIWNATACGAHAAKTPSYALLIRRAAAPELHGLLLSGFDYALDIRDLGTSPTLSGLALVDQPGAELDERDDDEGLDEVAWLASPERGVLTRASPGAPSFPSCQPPPAGMLPASPIPLAKGLSGPPDDGFFDPDARWLGAFAGPEDDWTAGGWAIWEG
ncbi:serine/threonine protein kinase [Pseudenhygromyxa sp. WMMC2535]|nr:serine/threonine-protein kinase [Pseudenhygromyxa sp. WMMC2535]NVB42441.1 serine/threonine protein kinase [Pseudenhygromyxa sp. WMMC2535]